MQSNILWTGEEYHSLENCLLTVTEDGAHVQSVIVGMHEGVLYKVEYTLRTNALWQTLFCHVTSRFADNHHDVLFESDGKGHWLKDGKTAEEFSGCTDVDIPLTPFTNTLPINRLKLLPATTREIQVVYIDVLAGALRPVTQKYTRLSEAEYKYENVPNDFEAVLTVDGAGLVIHYPELFIRSAKLPSHYPLDTPAYAGSS